MTPGIHTISQYIDILAAMILVTAFLIVSSRSLTFYVRLFSLQSLFLALVAFLVAIGYGETHILTAAILTVVVKVIAIPFVLTRITDAIKVRKEIDFTINVTVSLLICGGLVIVADSVAQPILSAQNGSTLGVSRVLPASIAMIMIGMFIMVARKKALTQLIGLLTMENGLFLSGLAITYGMPLIVEVGIFFDILMAALILGVFMYRINRTFESISMDTLRSLRH
jgi:hydrogenase-4 component E